MSFPVQDHVPFRLLLVEDNLGDADLVREGLADLLDYNYDLTHVTSLRDATEAMRSRQVDVAILDLNLPDSVGIETLRRLRQVQGDVPIVLLSGTNSAEMHAMALREGAQDFIGKNEPVPFILARSILYAKEKQWAQTHQRQIQQLVDANPDGVVVLDQEGLVQYVNQSAIRLLEKPLETFLGHPIEFPVRDDAVSEWSFPASDGLRTIETRAAHILWMGKPATLASIHDTTSQKRLQDQLRQAQKMEAIGRLAGGIAHDFNNILMAISGNVRLAQEQTPTGSPLKAHLVEIEWATTRATGIVKQILTFSRQRETAFAPITVETVICEISRFLTASLPPNVTIETTLDPDLPPIQGDITQIHQVLMNLGMNGAYAMRERGGVLRIAVRTEVIEEASKAPSEMPAGNYVIISVSDTGHGMDARTMDKIFEPFFTTKEKGEGTGLGLSVVHGIIKAHRGAITVQSTPSEGTTFFLYFPVTKHTPAVAEPEPEAPKSVTMAGSRLLYVDDEESLVKLARAALPAFGYQVYAFCSARAALEVFRQDPGAFDAVASDMSMPDVDGRTFAREVLAIRPEIPVILLSGFIRERDKAIAREIGVREILLKPVMPEDLHAVLQTHLFSGTDQPEE